MKQAQEGLRQGGFSHVPLADPTLRPSRQGEVSIDVAISPCLCIPSRACVATSALYDLLHGSVHLRCKVGLLEIQGTWLNLESTRQALEPLFAPGQQSPVHLLSHVVSEQSSLFR